MTRQPDLFVAQAPHIFRVREINAAVRKLLDEGFAEVVVEGEISNARQQTSGHWYFTLKDEEAQLAALLFRGDAARLRFRPENGLHVRASGRLTLYVPQGRYQMQVRTLVPVGQGALELAFRQLKETLQAEGLFDPARKRALPRFPHRVALVTSPTGAAVRDMLSTLAARWPLAHVLVVPVAVQGDSAPFEIVRALQLLDRRDLADVIVLGRGGGSLEDLWAFNDAGVARAIAATRVPVVTGVGHEVDITIADFVADHRAATPTAAAALVVPHRDEVGAQVSDAERRAARALRRRLDLPRQRLELLLGSYGMRSLLDIVSENAQAVDERLERLGRAARTALARSRSRADAARAQLGALSPRAVLERGYTYCVDAETGGVLTRAAQAAAGRHLHIHFADGSRPARVLEAAAAGRSVEPAGKEERA